jgi:hypothetical protein
VRGSKAEYEQFKDADASYQDRESYKIVVEPMSSVYVHECPSESPAQGKIGSSWLTEGKRAIRIHFWTWKLQKIRFSTPISGAIQMQR